MRGSSRKSGGLPLSYLRGITAQVGRGEFDLESGKTSGEFFNRFFAFGCSPQKICLLIVYMGLRIPREAKRAKTRVKKSLCLALP